MVPFGLRVLAGHCLDRLLVHREPFPPDGTCRSVALSPSLVLLALVMCVTPCLVILALGGTRSSRSLRPVFLFAPICAGHMDDLAGDLNRHAARLEPAHRRGRGLRGKLGRQMRQGRVEGG